MALVAYSDSEGSENEKPQSQLKIDKPTSKPAGTSTSNFTVNKANPRKIQVKLHDVPTNGEADGEPAPKRPRLGGGAGAFSGFNAMLPPPKRDSEVKTAAKPSTRKVFSLKTGAEPGFSRESDAELRQLFAEQGRQNTNGAVDVDVDETIPSIPKSTNPTVSTAPQKASQGNTFMFKPLSVARNHKKPQRKVERPKSTITPAQDGSRMSAPAGSVASASENPKPVSKKPSLFSMDDELEAPVKSQPDDEDEIIEVLDDSYDQNISPTPFEEPPSAPGASQPQSLDAIASDLNLSKADRRQLFGRRGPQGGAVNVVNFNTDQEYAANEAFRASGEQVQHNPVRAIAPGKHSLKQLVNAATGQKDALEESFAMGRKNKKEAGSKYGW
ncbi:hypothetical protein G647_01008 [Cladophialophora carrionii CBS 160.54]|uniref:Mitotic checkpoint regulator, MAD2B-interacting-domain-containing protein n=1 Tax=Cladophialophora carrionii CBS 160.54 TaxID=1279043 RepID=V9DQH0_9EURO|nr:uncharacterized protein G647_01008 [Cladophialophora carrionii CBS 160.54]ETI28558.1 hypothetical protein G647_01008 [Cladophialophora carrionii CBS 160.54]